LTLYCFIRTSFGFRIIRRGRRCNLFIRGFRGREPLPFYDEPPFFADPGVDIVAAAAIEVGCPGRDKGVLRPAAGTNSLHRDIEVMRKGSVIFHG